MRKFLLSGFIIGTFIIYALGQHFNGSGNSSVVSPSASSGNQTTVPSANTPNSKTYKDGQYTGDSVDAYYGNVQVKAIISGGKITDVQFLDYPRDRQTSIEVNSQATPLLKTEAIQAQNANVDIISGATATSQAFSQSLQSALAKAQ